MSSQPNVPQPPVKPVIGNLTEIDAEAPVQGFMELSRKYGPFFKMQVFDRTVYIASSQELVNELCDETRFNKRVHPPLEEIRAFAKDGLFTAYSDEPNWAKAHRILIPALGPIGVRGMFDQMLDIADQMFVRWERFGPNTVIDVPDNMTRLTLDTIALCAFDYRFNSFYQDEMHPFVGAMVGALKESGQRSRRPKLVSNLMLSTARQYQADADLMRGVARELIDERRRDPKGAEKKDLLNLMLNGVDPETGEKLSDENIGYQMITFLIAGHETTSGLLSFATYLLLKNPEVLQKARALVDEVLGDEMPRIEHLAQLRYIEQILMESLRLWPTAAVFGVKPLEDTVLAGKYPLTTQDTVLILEPMLHRDPKVWDEPETFRPERFAPENAEKLPPNAWKPFGNGARACIGRPFAMQEAQLVVAMMLQRFDFVLDDPKTPMIMICAGSGIAPFRGFLQDRAAQKAGGQEVGPSLLFFGTNHPDIDYLYHDELSAWEREGVVEVLPAFSHRPDGDVKFVQDRVWAERERIAQLFQIGATVFVCGDGRRMAPAVRETLIRIYREARGVTESEADQWADEIEREHGRYVADVFA